MNGLPPPFARHPIPVGHHRVPLDRQQLPEVEGKTGFENNMSAIHLRTRMISAEIHSAATSPTVAGVLRRACNRLPRSRLKIGGDFLLDVEIAARLFARVIGGWNARSFKKDEQFLLMRL